MSRSFGTDGIRGEAGRELTAEFAVRVGYTTGKVLRRHYRGRKLPYFRRRETILPPPAVLLARDPRLSSPMLASAVASGVLASGVNVVNLGMVPTPVLAIVLNALESIGGIVITASHNPIQDNGIKVFRSNGLKAGPGVERDIELLLEHPEPCKSGRDFGSMVDYDARTIYFKHLKRVLGLPRDGARVVLDLAHGATAVTAPEAFQRFGFTTTLVHADPDGRKVNVGCGSTHLKPLMEAVRSSRADWGFAFDGDGDRVMAVDALGREVDGDKIMTILTLHERRYRRDGRLVFTEMSNLGVELYLNAHGITTYRTAVGDTHVLEKMRHRGIDIGGEQSGHIICWDKQCTGDGVLVALLLSRLLSRNGRELGELAEEIPTYPQVLVNIPLTDNRSWQENRSFLGKMKQVIRKYHRRVRVFVRPSGTESVVRVLTEAEDSELARDTSDEIAGLFATLQRS